jgi:hypothetical protein
MSGDPTTPAAAVEEAEAAERSDGAVVLGWRMEQLISVGYDGESALALALDSSVDLHVAQSLVNRGCPPETAVRILL